MIHFFPYHYFEVKSKQNIEIVLSRFSNYVNIVPVFSFATTNSFKDFEGMFLKNEFKLKRNIKFGRNSFLPILSCQYTDKGSHTLLKVKISFVRNVNIGLIVFFLFQLSFLIFDFSFIGIIVIPYLVILFIYNRELRFLIKVFNEIIRIPESDSR